MNSTNVEENIVENVKQDLIKIFKENQEETKTENENKFKIVSLIMEDNQQISHVSSNQTPQIILFGDLYLVHNLLGFKYLFFYFYFIFNTFLIILFFIFYLF